MKKSKEKIDAALAVLTGSVIILMTGCGKTESGSGQLSMEMPPVISEEQQGDMEAQSATHTAGMQENSHENGQEQSEETGSIMRAYSDREQERMKELQESYQNETAKPEKMIQEVDSAEAVTKGTLCYIISTGQFYLPDRELTDEELLEIIDCNFRIAINANGWTQDKVDEANLKDRAALEEKVKAADGISQEEAIEIARKAMETDLGEKSKGLKLVAADERYGWKAYLWDITDWDEYKDKGDIGWFVQFSNVEEAEVWEDMFSYDCMVNALDGSICGANSLQGGPEDNTIVWFEH